MTARIGHLSLVDARNVVAAPALAAVPEPPAWRAVAEPAIADVIPASPPAEVREQVTEALDRVRELAADDRELHFRKDEATGRVIVEVRDLDGNVLRTIPPSEALDVMSRTSSI